MTKGIHCLFSGTLQCATPHEADTDIVGNGCLWMGTIYILRLKGIYRLVLNSQSMMKPIWRLVLFEAKICQCYQNILRSLKL